MSRPAFPFGKGDALLPHFDPPCVQLPTGASIIHFKHSHRIVDRRNRIRLRDRLSQIIGTSSILVVDRILDFASDGIAVIYNHADRTFVRGHSLETEEISHAKHEESRCYAVEVIRDLQGCPCGHGTQRDACDIF